MAQGLQTDSSRIVVAGTGHRPQMLNPLDASDRKFGFTPEAHEALLDVARDSLARIRDNHPDKEITVISGVALGFDQALAQAALEAEMRVVAAVPFKGQENRWGRDSQAAYRQLLDRIVAAGGEVHVVSPGGYNPAKMQTRNEWMVDRANIVLGLNSGHAGGTVNCIDYARQQGKEIVNVWESYERRVTQGKDHGQQQQAAERASAPRAAAPEHGRDESDPLRIVHVKDHLDDRSGAVVYVGRRMPAYEFAASPLANNFEVGRDGSRDEVRDKYRTWLRTEFATQGSPARDELLRIRDLSLSGADVALSYWATGNECHADIVREAVIKLAERERAREQIISGRDGQSREDGARAGQQTRPGRHDSRAQSRGGDARQQSNQVPSPASSQARADVLAYSRGSDNVRELYEVSDGRTRAEHASYLNERSQSARDTFERGAVVYEDVLIIPKEYDVPRGEANITTHQYAARFVGGFTPDERVAKEKAAELVQLAEQISGQWADPQARIAVFKHLYDQVSLDEHGRVRNNADRPEALERTLEGARELAAEMVLLEPQDSLSAAGEHELAELHELDGLSHENEHHHDENTVYAQMYEDAVLATREGSAEHEQIEVESRGGGSMPEVSYERVSLSSLPPAVPEGISLDAESRLLEVTLPEVDRRIESGESRQLIMKEVIYSEHGALERADKRDRVVRAFAASAPEAARDTPPSRREQLQALSTLHALAVAEAARESVRYSPEALRWARDYYSRTEPDATQGRRAQGTQHGAAVPNPAARDLYVANEKDIRLSQQQLLRMDRVPTREGVEHVEGLERAAANIAASIDRMQPSPQERAAALDVVASRIQATISAENDRLTLFEQATATRESAESRLGRPLAHASLREHLRDELAEANHQIDTARKEYLAQLGQIPDTPAQAREAVTPRVQSLERALELVNAEREALGVARSAEPVKSGPQQVFVSLNNDASHRLPVENVREHAVVTRMADANRLNVNTWHGLHGREVTGASQERDLVARFVGNYIDYRMQDAGTRMLNQSQEYREYSRRLDECRSVEELRTAAKEIRQENYQRGEQFKAHRLDPQNTERPERRALGAHEMRNLFLAPAPAHYTAELRDLRHGLSVSGKDKENLIRGLERGEIAPSQNLSSLLRELDGRRTPEALGHFSASLTTPADQMRRPSQTDLHAVHQKLLPYEKDYLYRLLEAKRDEARDRVRQERTQEVGARANQEPSQAREALTREEARALTASQTFREYYAAAAWREAEMFTADRARRDVGMAPSESRSTIVNGVSDRHVEAAGYIVNNLDSRKAQDVATYLKSSQDESLRTTGEIVEVFSKAERSPTADGRVELSLRPSESSRVTDREWEHLLGNYQPDRAADNKNLRERLPAAHLSEIRRDAQVAAWKEMEPKVRATGYRTDSRAEVLYSSLDVRDALDKTRSQQERARTAHRAVETHVEHCAAAVEKALANPVAIHRASPEALRIASHITRAGSMVASIAGIQPVARSLGWVSQNLQQSAASAEHVREFGVVERTPKDVQTTRELVRAALDPEYAKTQEALVSKNAEQFSFIRETITPKQQSQYNALDRHAQRTKDDYLRSFGELDNSQRALAEAQGRDTAERGVKHQAQGQTQEQQSHASPAREEYTSRFETREAELLGQRLEELIQSDQLPARDALPNAHDLRVSDLIPRSEREAFAEHARDDSWREMMPGELTGNQEHVDERVLGHAAEVADRITSARQAEAELLEAREASAGGDGAHSERLAAAEANYERAFGELDRSQASLDLAREESQLAERTERFNEIKEPLEQSVREYLDGAYREDGLEAFHDADLAEEHVAGLSQAMHDCIREQGTTLEQLNLNERDVEQIARNLVSSLSNTLDRSQTHELHRDMMQGLPQQGVEAQGRAQELAGRVGAEHQHGDFAQEHSARERNERDEHILPDRDGTGGMRPRDAQHEHTEGTRGMEQQREAARDAFEHMHDFAGMLH